MSTPVQFDTRALTEPIDPAALAEYRRMRRQTFTTSGTKIVGAIVALVMVVVAVGVIGTVAFSIGRSGGRGGNLTIILLVAVATIFGLIFWRTRVARMRRDFRLSRFAAANAMQFVPTVDAPGLPGMIFTIGSGRQASAVLRGSSPRPVEFADYEFTTGSGKNKQTHRWHYVAVRMQNRLPNIVLDAESNNVFFGSNLPSRFHRDQQLSLEGDFNQHFRLYCPQGYESDALYLFTPDVMANFIDTAGAFDVEIIDDWVFLYMQGTPNALLPETWERQFRAVRALLTKIAQWERWRDDRLAAPPAATPAGAQSAATAAVGFAGVGAPDSAPQPGAVLPPMHMSRPKGVAPQGQRLRRSVSWGGWLIVGAVALFWLLREFIPAMFGVLGP